VFGYHYSDSPCSPVEPIPREDRRERLENRRLKRAYRFCWNPPCALGSKRKDCSCSPAASLVYPVVPPTDRYRGRRQCPAPGQVSFVDHFFTQTTLNKCPGNPPFHSPHSRRVPYVRTSVARISYLLASATSAYAAFSQRKPYEVAQRDQPRQEIRDTWVSKDGRSPSKVCLFVFPATNCCPE
jgi:hypothetical protein